MKFVIDLIEEIREEIQNQGDFTLLAMLLKENESKDLVFAGEAVINEFSLINEKFEFYIKQKLEAVSVGKLLTALDLLPNEAMMHPITLNIGSECFDVIGFGKSHEEKKFVLFIQK